jgi:glutathione synthase/RimK-type ligase-like ATP-grasp enzyme
MRIHFLINQRAVPEPSPVLLDVYAALRDRSVEVDSSIPEDCVEALADIEARHDLYVLKSHTELALSVAGVLRGKGGRVLNPFQACVQTQDKIISTALLASAGVPVPQSWVTEDLCKVASLLPAGPLIAKPHRGHWGRGIRIIRTVEDSEELASVPGPYLVQRYMAADKEELKAYVVGRRAFGVLKAFSPTSFQDPGRPVALERSVEDIVLACGEALGLHLYGVDLVRTDAGPFVVDVNYFPGYKGVPGAAGLLAEYIYDFAANGGGDGR